MPEKQIGNWGKWGPDDERGTLNYLTPEIIKNAVGLVKKGKVYSLAVPIDKDGPVLEYPAMGAFRNRPILVNGIFHYTNAGLTGEADAALDTLTIDTHCLTHIDALAHCWYDGKMYNGFTAAENMDGHGTKKLGIDRVKWLVGRGVFLDIARYKGVNHLEKGQVITPEDMEGCARIEGIEIRHGDIILIRTGWLNLFKTDLELYRSGRPGLGRAAATWFKEREICAVGADMDSVEVDPGEVTRLLAFHCDFIRNQGGYIMEVLDLEELAKDEVYEFLFVAAPLVISRGVGSPLNPLAIA